MLLVRGWKASVCFKASLEGLGRKLIVEGLWRAKLIYLFKKERATSRILIIDKESLGIPEGEARGRCGSAAPPSFLPRRSAEYKQPLGNSEKISFSIFSKA